MSSRAPSLLIDDILESAHKILLFTSNMTFQDFINDAKTVDAVIRNFEIIGEVANRLPEDFKEKNEDINWHRLRGFRNRIVHDYIGIDYQIVWQIKETFLIEIIEKLSKL